MTTLSPPETTSPLRRTLHVAAPLLERLGRFGYVAKAIVYIVVGLLALRYAIGGGGRASASSAGALTTIFLQPLGPAQLAVLIVGLAAYAIWQLIAAFVDGEQDGSHVRGYAFRAGKLLGCAGYALLAFQAARTLAGHLGRRDKVPELTGEVLALPGGRALVGLVGAGIFLFAIYQGIQAIAARELRHVDLERLPALARALTQVLARLGFAARAVIFAVIGRYLWDAARHYDPRQATGLSGAFGVLGQRAYGAWLLGTVALGLVAYGAYQMINAGYRRMDARPDGGLRTAD